MSSHSLPGHDAIASLPMAIAQLRMTIGTPSVDEDHPLLNAEHWPGIIESMGLLTTLHHSTVQSSRQGPYSWHCVRALFQLLKLVQADSYAGTGSAITSVLDL